MLSSQARAACSTTDSVKAVTGGWPIPQGSGLECPPIMPNEMGAENIDLRNQPAYALAEAARYLKLPAATLRSWVAGRPYPKAEGVGRFQPLIHPPRKQPPLLSFWNLIEAHVLRSLRTDHGVSIR